jgi:hypothetical protein
MKHGRTVDLLMKLRRLHEMRAQEQLAASEAAVRAAEAEVIAARERHQQHMEAAVVHEHDVIVSLRDQVMTATALERIQRDLDILKENGEFLGRSVATAQSVTRTRRKEERVARELLRQKQREVMKLEALEEEMTTEHLLYEETLLEVEDEDRLTSGTRHPHSAQDGSRR